MIATMSASDCRVLGCLCAKQARNTAHPEEQRGFWADVAAALFRQLDAGKPEAPRINWDVLSDGDVWRLALLCKGMALHSRERYQAQADFWYGLWGRLAVQQAGRILSVRELQDLFAL